MTPNCHTFFTKKNSKKCDHLGTCTQNYYFWTPVRVPKVSHFFQQKKRWKSGTLWEHLPKRYHFWTIIKQKRKKSGTLWGHGLYINYKFLTNINYISKFGNYSMYKINQNVI